MSQHITTSPTTATSIPPTLIVPSFEEEDTLTDGELCELEMRLARDHDDACYWTGGRHV